MVTYEHPWTRLSDGGFEDEVSGELAPGHQLFGRQFRGVARCDARDDVLFEVDETDWVVVHLTYKKPDTPPWPTFLRFASEEAAHQWIVETDPPTEYR